MSDAQKLKDAIKEHSQAKKRIEDTLKAIEDSVRQTRQEQRGELDRLR